jgi:hypothetical protein
MLLMCYIAYVLRASYFRPAYMILAKWREAKIARGCSHERPVYGPGLGPSRPFQPDAGCFRNYASGRSYRRGCCVLVPDSPSSSVHQPMGVSCAPPCTARNVRDRLELPAEATSCVPEVLPIQSWYEVAPCSVVQVGRHLTARQRRSLRRTGDGWR